MNVRPGPCAFAFLLLLSAACGGPPTPSPIEGEPICPDFEIGATRAAMRGSLRYPVTVTVLDDGDPVTRATIYGRRTKDAPASRILLADEDAEYDVEWGQCENQRAPRPVSQTFESRDAAEYACGNAVVYKTEKLVTKKGDPASRTLHFPAPPKQECWESEVPKAAEAPPAADAGVEQPQADAAVDADAAVEDAGTAAPDAAKPAQAPATAPDAAKPAQAPSTAPDAAKPAQAPAAAPDAAKPAQAPAPAPDTAKPAQAPATAPGAGGP